MRRPIPSASIANNTLNNHDNTRKKVDDLGAQTNADYEKRLKLAALLHDQGINPPRWQEAEQGPYEAQRRYQETRHVPDEMFMVHDRLYRRSPAIAATPAQGQDALDVYLGAAPKPISELVPVAEVQLRHPLGNRPDSLPEGVAALERYRHFAKLGIDPDHAHEGDAIPHHLQDGLKRAVTSADGKEIPLGIPGVYRNPDDGFFYLAHSGTEEGLAVKDLRGRLVAEKMERTGSTDPVATNDSDPDIDEAVAQFYWRERDGRQENASVRQKPVDPNTSPTTDISKEFREQLELIVSGLKKHLAEEELTAAEEQALMDLAQTARKHERYLSPHEIDVEELERIAGILEDPEMQSPLAMGLTTTFAGLPALAPVPGMLDDALAKIGPRLAQAGAAARWLSGIGTFLALMRPTQTAGPQTGESAPIGTAEELLDLLARQAAGKSNPAPSHGTDVADSSEVPGSSLQSANDNQPDPANDNDPSQGPNQAVTTAATIATALMDEGLETPGFMPSERFDPDSQDMRDFQEDFAHAILQGQLPEIWLNGKLVTVPNPYGSKGRPIVQELDEKTAVAVAQALEQCKGIINVQRLGGGATRPQFHIGDLDGKGNQNSVRLDLTLGFKHGKYECFYHINSIDTTKSGHPTLRENRSAERMRSNIEKIVERLAEAKDRRLPHADKIGESGYAYDSIRKPLMDDTDVNEIIRNFMETVFSCARITRECRRTFPQER